MMIIKNGKLLWSGTTSEDEQLKYLGKNMEY